MNTPITFTQGKSITGAGGVFYIVKARNIEISSSSFDDYKSLNSGSFMYSMSESLNLSVSNSTFNSKVT